MSSLFLDGLPDLPQTPLLRELAADLWAEAAVVAVWLGGSLARGAGDAYSDVDLRVAVTPEAFATRDHKSLPSFAARLAGREVARAVRTFGDDAVLHHLMLDDGQIYDLFVQTTAHEPTDEARLILGCRDAAFAERLRGGADPLTRFAPADPAQIRRVLETFWMGQVKHQRVLFRGLPLLSWYGEHLMRQELLRLYFVLATGDDGGPTGRASIHTLSPVTRAVQEYCGPDALRLIGEPLRSEEEIVASTARLQDEMARVGRLLAERLGFDYPGAAEATARRTWAAFRAAATDSSDAAGRISGADGKP